MFKARQNYLTRFFFIITIIKIFIAMKFVLQKIFAFCAAVLIASAAFAASTKELKPVKYVFLFIGDGMSIPQRMMTEEYLRLCGEGGLKINAFPNNAVTYTRSNDSLITDSAASGTAIACGTKTDNGKIGVDTKGNKLESIASVAKKSGKKVGIITSVTINHATPAAFYAHNSSRGNYYEIALDMIESDFDFFGGGGVQDSDDKKSKSYKGDIYELAKEAGYKVVLNDAEEFEKLGDQNAKTMAFASKGALPYAIDDNSGLRIKDFLEKAVEIMEDHPKGFFIMVEGGKIDWMCHANDAATVLKEVVDLDKCVREACEFAKKHPDDTLIVVTGDHETGGLTLGFAGTGYKSYINLLSHQKNSREQIEKTIKEMKKKNPELSFDDLKPYITKTLGLKFGGDKKDRLVLTKDEENILRKAFEKASSKKGFKADGFAIALTHCLDNKAALGWTSTAHTALPVSTTAAGAQSEAFNGTIDNTDIAKMLKQAVK